MTVAESVIQVTSGGGPKIHTVSRTGVGGNTVEEQGVFPSEYPYSTSYVVAGNVSTATAGSHILAVMAGASLNVRIRRFRVEQGTNATTATSLTLTVVRLTSAGSGGTVVTAAPYDTSDTPGLTARTLPTSKGTESTEVQRSVLVMRQAVSATTAQVDDQWEWVQLPHMKPIIIPAGTSNGLAFINTAVAGATLNIILECVETAY